MLFAAIKIERIFHFFFFKINGYAKDEGEEMIFSTPKKYLLRGRP